MIYICRALAMTLFIFCGWVELEGKEKVDSEAILILNMEDEATLPKRFRTAQSPFISEDVQEPLPTREGLDHLRISGSSQFSEKGLKVLISDLQAPHPLYILDLREECHGFVNGTAVSWYGIKNWGNVGKIQEQIEYSEKQLLEDTKLAGETIVHRVIKKDDKGLNLPETQAFSMNVNWVATEQELSTNYPVYYLRMPTTDHVRPSDETVDRFIALVQGLPQSGWIHFHCAAGAGRTTTFMVMYDMMKNAKAISFEDIIKRQWYLGGINLTKDTKDSWKAPCAAERVRFLEEFYQYCKNNQDHFQQKWSDYVQEKHVSLSSAL